MIANMIRLADVKGYKKDDLRGIIDDSRSIIENFGVTLQLVASFTIVIYYLHIL